MVRVLVTGFGPFPGVTDNPSARIVAHLARERLRGHLLATHVFPTSYRDVDRELHRTTTAFRPEVLVMFGLAATSPHIRIETIAHNHIGRQADVAGYVPVDPRIGVSCRSELRGRARFARLVRAARAAGVKAEISVHAGDYLCNYAYWRAIEALRPAGVRSAVFVHVPDPRGPNAFSLPSLVRACRALVLAAAEGPR